MSVDPFTPPQAHSTFSVATQPELRALAHPLVPQGAGERLVREAEVYLAGVDFFRAEGLEPTWQSENGVISFRARYALDGACELSAAGEGTEGRK